MKFRLVLETKTKNGHPVVLKFNVAPSKHQGLINFLKIALNDGHPVNFTVEKIEGEERELSKVKGTFDLEPLEDPEQFTMDTD